MVAATTPHSAEGIGAGGELRGFPKTKKKMNPEATKDQSCGSKSKGLKKKKSSKWMDRLLEQLGYCVYTYKHTDSFS
jgi:hypothetical protein